MITKCDKCEDKAWCWSCDECQSKPYLCFMKLYHLIYVMKLYHIEIVTLIRVSITMIPIII